MNAACEDEVVRATVAALRYAAGLAFYYNEELARILYDTAGNTELVGADFACCPVCEEVRCDEGCALEPLRSGS